MDENLRSLQNNVTILWRCLHFCCLTPSNSIDLIEYLFQLFCSLLYTYYESFTKNSIQCSQKGKIGYFLLALWSSIIAMMHFIAKREAKTAPFLALLLSKWDKWLQNTQTRRYPYSSSWCVLLTVLIQSSMLSKLCLKISTQLNTHDWIVYPSGSPLHLGRLPIWVLFISGSSSHLGRLSLWVASGSPFYEGCLPIWVAFLSGSPSNLGLLFTFVAFPSGSLFHLGRLLNELPLNLCLICN